MRRGELLADSILDKQMRTKVLAVAIMAAFFGAPVQAASTEQGAPAYASTLRRAVIFENDTDSKLPLAERMERWKVPGLSVAVIDGCKLVDRHGFGVTRRGDRKRVGLGTSGSGRVDYGCRG